MSAANRVVLSAAGATVAVLAGVAGAISHSHMAELARPHGEVDWRSHAFPVSADGIEVVASLVLLAHRRAGSSSGWLPWAALVAGTAASVAANVAVGGSDPIGRLVAGWPPERCWWRSSCCLGCWTPTVPDQSRTRRLIRGVVLDRRSAVDVIPAPLAQGARVVRDQLVAVGSPVNRRSLAAGLRAAGHRVGNDRLGPQLAVVSEGGDGDDGV